MTLTLQLLGGLGLLLATGLVPLAGRPLRGTTLRTAWLWTLAALAFWWAAWIANWSGRPVVVDPLWYAAAVMSLAPFVQVLGARRPISQSWTWFVILPMLAVLGLPLATSLGTESFEIELPALLGFLLVLTMGAGNYFGTRFTGPVLVIAMGLAGVALSGSMVWPAGWPSAATMRSIAGVLLGLGVLGIARRAHGGEHIALERAWIEFRDLYGIVWAKRVMDRVNESLEAAESPWQLDLTGINPTEPLAEPPSPDADPDDPYGEQAAHRIVGETFSWLLRRFVDDAWAARFGIELRGSGEPTTEGDSIGSRDGDTGRVR